MRQGVWTAAAATSVVVPLGGMAAFGTLNPVEPLFLLADLCFGEGDAMGAMSPEHQAMSGNQVPLWVPATLVGLVGSALMGVAWFDQSNTDQQPEAQKAEYNKKRVFDAMVFAAGATGGISKPELEHLFSELTGDLPPVGTVPLRRPTQFSEWGADLSGFENVASEDERRFIMLGALAVGWTHGAYTQRALDLIGRLADCLGQTPEMVAELFEALPDPGAPSSPAAAIS